MATTFDPSQPFTVEDDEPKFDPSQPFELEPESRGIIGSTPEFAARVARGAETGVQDIAGGFRQVIADTFRGFQNPYVTETAAAAESEIPQLEQQISQKKAEYDSLYPKATSFGDFLSKVNKDPIGSTKRSQEIYELEQRLGKAREAAKGVTPESFAGSLSRSAEDLVSEGEQNKANIKTRYSPYVDELRNQEFWMKVADSLGQSAPSTGSAILNAPLGLAMMFSQTYAGARDEYEKSMAEQGLPVDEDAASEYATKQASIQTPLEVFGDLALAGTIARSLGGLLKQGASPSKLAEWVKDRGIDLAKSAAGETLITTPGQSVSEDIIAEQAGVRAPTTVGQKAGKAYEQSKIALAQSIMMGGGPIAVEGTAKIFENSRLARETAKAEAEQEIITNADRVADETEAYAPASADALRIKARMNAEEAKRKIDEEFDAQEKAFQEEQQSKMDELLAKSEEEMAAPKEDAPEAAPEESSATEFAPPQQEVSLAVEMPRTEAEERNIVVNETPVSDQQTDLLVEDEQQAARTRVEEALATGVTPSPEDIALAGAAVETAQPTIENVLPNEPAGGRTSDQPIAANDPTLKAEGIQAIQGDIGAGSGASEAIPETSGEITDAPTEFEPPQPAGEAGTPESSPADQPQTIDQSASSGGEVVEAPAAEPTGSIATPRRVQLRGTPASFEVLEAIEPTAAEQERGERFYRVRNERTGEEQTVEANDIAREIRPKSERVRKAVTKLPKAQQTKAEQATEVDTSPDPYQGSPLSSAAPLELDDNLDMLEELSEYGVFEEDATAATVLQKIRDNPKSEDWQKRLAQRLLGAGIGNLETLAVYRPDEGGWSALYVPSQQRILFNLARGNPGVAVATLHEASHDVTLRQIKNPQSLKGEARKAYNDLQEIYNSIKNRPEFQTREGEEGPEYGISNVQEMVAEAFSNAGFRRKLDAIKDGPRTLWQKFVNAIARLLFNKSAAYDSLLHRTIENAFTLGGAPVIESRVSGTAAMAESPEWRDVIGNNNASEEAEAKAYAQMGEEVLDDTDLTAQDVKPLTDAQRELLMPSDTFNPMGLVFFWARQFNNIRGTTFEDRVGMAKDGLIKAAKKYDPEKGYKFFSYASSVIKNHMLNERRNIKNRAKYVQEDAPVYEDETTETITSTTPSPEDLTLQENEKNRMRRVAGEALQAVMDRASERDQGILSDYARGDSLRTVGAAYNMSQEGVRKVLKKFREQVSNALLLRGITDIQEIIQPVEPQTEAAAPSRRRGPEDEQVFQESTIGELEAGDIERTEPLYQQEADEFENELVASDPKPSWGMIEGGTDDPWAKTFVSNFFNFVTIPNNELSPKTRDTLTSIERGVAQTNPSQEPGATRQNPTIRAQKIATGSKGEPAPFRNESGENLAEFLDLFQKATGKVIRYIKAEEGTLPFAAMIRSEDPNVIYLNPDGDRNVIALVGHEWGHTVERQDPELYADLKRQLLPYVDNWKSRVQEIKGVSYDGWKKKSSELTSNIIGDVFVRPEFWQYLRSKDQDLFTRAWNSFKRFIRGIVEGARKSEWGTEKFISDMEAVQSIVAETLREAIRRGPYPSTPESTISDDEFAAAPMAERRPSPEAVSEIQKSVNSLRRTYIPPAVRPGEAYEVDPKAQSVWSAILDKGQLPASLKDVYDRLGNRINGIRGKVKVYTDDVKRAVNALHKTKEARDAEYGRIQNALTQEGDMKISDLDESLQGPVWKIRNTIDTLSQAAIDYGIVDGDLADTFRNGIGNYLRRGYAVFDPESGWNYKFLQKKKPEILAAARNYLKQKNPEATADQIETTIKDLLDRDTAAGFMLGGKKVLGKSIGSLMERKDIAKPIRDLLGEIKDPLVNLVRSGDFLGQLIAREEMQQEFRKVALKEGLVSAEQNSTMTSPLVEDTWLRTVDDDGNPIFRIRTNRRYDVLRGLHTTPEFRKAFELAEKFGDAGAIKRASDMLLGGFLTASATAKTFATVLNPDSYAPNYIGAFMVEMANGRWKPSTWKDAWAAMRSGKNPNTVISAAKQAGIKDARSLYNELIRGGIFDQNITFRDFEATLKNSWLAKLAHHKKSPLEAIGALYSTGDNLGKANAFVDEITTLKKAYPDMPYRELVDQATQLVADTTPTYSTVPKAFRDISQVGFFLQNFFNFVYSINRVAGYTAYHGIRELRSGNPVLQARGARRLTGLAMVLAASSYWGAAMLSRAHEDFDEDKDQAFRRSFAAPWDRDANLVYANTKDGKVTYSNTSYLNPFALITETLNAVIQGKSPTEAAQGAVRTVMGNFFSEGIFLSAVLDVARNRKKGTDQAVYNEELDTWAKAMEGTGYVINKALTPKVINKAIRTYKGATGEGGDYGKTYSAYDEALRLAGYRANTVDLKRSLTQRLYDLNARYRNAEKIERTAANKGRTGENLQYYTDQSNAAQQRVLNDYKTLLKDAQTLGIPTSDFIKAMSETKTQQEVRAALVQ